jgi:hypothetical protein
MSYRTALYVAMAAGLVAACSKDQLVVASGLPLGSASTRLSLNAERGDWLDVDVETGGRSYRFFLPDSEACRLLFKSEAAVRYANSGSFGRLATDETACDPSGILSLAAWRDRGPRNPRADVIPRSRSEFREVVYDDADMSLVRGRFLLAREIGFVGGGDSIAVIPKLPECAGLLSQREASMEFRVAGKTPYVLINGTERCPVLGFVKAPPPTP